MSPKMFTKAAVVALLAVSRTVSFDLQTYSHFLDQNSNLSGSQLIQNASPDDPYYRSIEGNSPQYLYLDSIVKKYELTNQEQELLHQNKFVVTERKSFMNFGGALRDIFNKDLPVFLTTDAVLYTVHMSYDAVLAFVERNFLKNAVADLLDGMAAAYPALQQKYVSVPQLQENLQDIDLYLTIARSLIDGALKTPSVVSAQKVQEIWDAIESEQYTEIPLFSTESRGIDFSQFTVRGHYVREQLENYFKTMIWLGRTEFLMTPPRQGENELRKKEAVRRTAIDALLLAELLQSSGKEQVLSQIDSFLGLIVGESDNLTVSGLSVALGACAIERADDLLSDEKFDALSERLAQMPEATQKILSQVIIVNPALDSLEYPVSFLLLGQRFIVDSYIFQNVIFDKITRNNQRVKRLMPDPLDAMYALGNDDAVVLLQNELEKFHYAPNLEMMRYLIDSYDSTFWHSSLYNVWLNAIRFLNPSNYPPHAQQPLFMKTAAWHQKKLNTQLASWAQLRHDNLLYAKQSYTPGVSCFYPHGYIEPYPDFYRELALFARKAAATFSSVSQTAYIGTFYTRVASLMDTLTMLAEKELTNTSFSTDDSLFLSRMLVVQEMCGAPVTAGWYGDLIFNNHSRSNETDYTIADVHTQPTDSFGNMVGNVLHVGVGKINLGVFLAQSPSADFKPMAYVGPVASYYQTVQGNFNRHTDEEWTSMVEAGLVPQRPDWVNSYLADGSGAAMASGRSLPGIPFTTGVIRHAATGKQIPLHSVRYSLQRNNPGIYFSLSQRAQVSIQIYDVRGRVAAKPVKKVFNGGEHVVSVPVASGTYTAVVSCDGMICKSPMMVLR